MVDFICTETLISRDRLNKFRTHDKLKAINEGKTMFGTIPPPNAMTDCPECKGKGRIMLFNHEHPCDDCDGSGKVSVKSDTKKEDEDDDDIYYGMLGYGF